MLVTLRLYAWIPPVVVQFEWAYAAVDADSGVCTQSSEASARDAPVDDNRAAHDNQYCEHAGRACGDHL